MIFGKQAPTASFRNAVSICKQTAQNTYSLKHNHVQVQFMSENRVLYQEDTAER